MADAEALAEYLTFQYTIGERTLFKGVHQLLPGHWLSIENESVKIARYWDVQYDIDFDHTSSYFERQIGTLLADSLKLHLRSDVPVGAYVSGGIDSSLIAILAAKIDRQNRLDVSRPFHRLSRLRRVRICRAGGADSWRLLSFDGHHGFRLSQTHSRCHLASGCPGRRAQDRSRNTWFPSLPANT